jgi:hypothetical protein
MLAENRYTKDLAQVAPPDKFAQRYHNRFVDQVKHTSHAELILARQFFDAFKFIQPDAQGLVAQHVFSMFERTDHAFAANAKIVPARDNIARRFIQHSLVRSVGDLNSNAGQCGAGFGVFLARGDDIEVVPFLSNGVESIDVSMTKSDKCDA